MADEPLSVLIVDDHPVVRDGVRAALEGRSGILVIGEAGSREEAVDAALRLAPDVALIDLHMPGGGVSAIRELGRACPHVKCLVLTMDEDDESLFGAMRAGACGYLLKGVRGAEIEQAVRAAGSGEIVFGAGVAETIKNLFDQPPPSKAAASFPHLTERDLELLALIADGRDNTDIARALSLAPKTVRNQVSLLLTKMGVTDRAAAVAVARDAGLGGKGRSR